mmetsp:Transcript_30052/g.50827  ORF Transcript_30052/g.50827 Transcript_30052/m.50827 type:complete len:259 (-) Transcript_30052:272-1048(-)
MPFDCTSAATTPTSPPAPGVLLSPLRDTKRPFTRGRVSARRFLQSYLICFRHMRWRFFSRKASIFTRRSYLVYEPTRCSKSAEAAAPPAPPAAPGVVKALGGGVVREEGISSPLGPITVVVFAETDVASVTWSPTDVDVAETVPTPFVFPSPPPPPTVAAAPPATAANLMASRPPWVFAFASTGSTNPPPPPAQPPPPAVAAVADAPCATKNPAEVEEEGVAVEGEKISTPAAAMPIVPEGSMLLLPPAPPLPPPSPP